MNQSRRLSIRSSPVRPRRPSRHLGSLLLVSMLWLPVGCGQLVEGQARPSGRSEDSPAIVDIAEASSEMDEGILSYSGVTEPAQVVSLRAQTEGQLLSLTVRPGDSVVAGQVVGQINGDLLQSQVSEAEAELAARQSEVAQAEIQVSDALARVEQVNASLEQAQLDADRFQSLAEDGAIAIQQADIARTTLRTTEQELRSAQEQVRTRQQAIASAQQRVAVQAELVRQARERLSFATLVAPIDAVVLERSAEPGNFIQPGQDVLTLGDFRDMQVVTQISDRDRAQVQVGQSARVEFDAIPGLTVTGQVIRISPIADPSSRLISVEIAIPNPQSQISSGLFARVRFDGATAQAVLVPESALAVSEAEDESVVFVIRDEGETVTVQPRSVQVGDRRNGRVEILSGLEPGEAYVVRSNRPLVANEPVQRSLLSES
jgi:HlyD family secretion protein